LNFWFGLSVAVLISQARVERKKSNQVRKIFVLDSALGGNYIV